MLYRRKYKIKIFIISLAIIIVGVFIYLLNNTISNIKSDERKQVMLWAEAVQRRYALVDYTNNLFEKLALDERTKAEIWSEAQHLILKENNPDFLTFLLKVLRSNKNIPIILTDSHDKIIASINSDFSLEIGAQMPDSIRSYFTKYPPIPITYDNKPINYLYYTDSRLFSDLQDVMNNMIRSFIEEVVKNSVSVPVLITSADSTTVIAYGNLNPNRIANPQNLEQTIQEMSEYNVPIAITNNNAIVSYIFYEDSLLITRLTYYPYILILISISLLILTYYAFRSSQKYEQNQVWVGMSKETAHQLGTPISSLMAWIELLEQQNIDKEIIYELNKDIQRLETITERFSKIGSKPHVQTEDIYTVIYHAIEYMKQRSSSKISYSISALQKNIKVPLNISLFEWVIENICKNAIDAMEGVGSITIYISTTSKRINIDIEDSGKGIQRNMFSQVFKPGFSTKTRGWGLGLSLAKRIIEEYHNGKIFVKNSEINKGTVFRISLPHV